MTGPFGYPPGKFPPIVPTMDDLHISQLTGADPRESVLEEMIMSFAEMLDSNLKDKYRQWPKVSVKQRQIAKASKFTGEHALDRAYEALLQMMLGGTNKPHPSGVPLPRLN